MDAANDSSATRRGIRIIDDNEDGGFFYGTGAFSSQPSGTPAPTQAETVSVNDFGPALPSKGKSVVAAVAKPKVAWSTIAKSNLPPSALASTASADANSASAPAKQSPTVPLCVYFMGGFCRFGDGCRFRHARAQGPAVSYFQSRIQQLIADDAKLQSQARERIGLPPLPDSTASGAAASNAAAGGSAGPAPTLESEAAFAQDSFRWQASAGALRSAMLDEAVSSGVCGDSGEAEVALHTAERNVSADVECGICLERVAEIPGRRFGLLTSCTHAFCLDCIRQWRGRIDLPTDTTRACPLCRQVSYFIIPCDRYIADAGRKAEVNASYHSSQKSIPCKHWDYGRGQCPFGISCFYAHLNLDGTPAVESARHAFLMDSEGKITGTKQAYQLAQFL